jgi:hypothetical protein
MVLLNPETKNSGDKVLCNTGGSMAVSYSFLLNLIQKKILCDKLDRWKWIPLIYKHIIL